MNARHTAPLHYYNDSDPFCCSWLQSLIEAGRLPFGVVDSRSIQDVHPDDLEPYTSCHFFAGIGGWALALRLAGWPDDRPVWTGSCPCQPFSCAGQRKGTDDARHLWPDFFRLIAQRMPPTVFGEQVASKDGRLWLSGVRSDLEALDYAVGAADLCAAGIGAPHIRQRLYWVADADGWNPGTKGLQRSWEYRQFEKDSSTVGRMALPSCERLSERHTRLYVDQGQIEPSGSPTGRLGNPDLARSQGCGIDSREYPCELSTGPASAWHPARSIACLDGKTRRISPQPGAFPLAHGVPARVGRLRGYGNAVVPQVAAEFIGAMMDLN